MVQGIFPTQGLNLGLPHCKWILYHLSHQGSPTYTSLYYQVNSSMIVFGRCLASSKYYTLIVNFLLQFFPLLSSCYNKYALLLQHINLENSFKEKGEKRSKDIGGQFLLLLAGHRVTGPCLLETSSYATFLCSSGLPAPQSSHFLQPDLCSSSGLRSQWFLMKPFDWPLRQGQILLTS